MKKWILVLIIISMMAVIAVGCDGSSEEADKAIVQEQQLHYQKIHPIPFYDYSIPRDVLTQIYDVVTTKAFTTYTVIESITGETKFHGPSIGYGIPVDSQLTNPLQSYYRGSSVVIEQAEPNGLFSSKNTDGTWVLFTQPDGQVVPIYTEHKVTTYPFAVEKVGNGWERVSGSDVEFNIDVKQD